MLVHFALLIQLVMSAWMGAVITYVQLVHYPSLHFIAKDKFCEFHKMHSLRTTYVVLIPMVAELATAAYLFAQQRTLPFAALLALAVLTWVMTFSISVPLHNRLGTGSDTATINSLISTNWLRFVTWLAKLALIIAIVLQLPHKFG